MLSKQITAILCLFFVCSAVAAETYEIRVNRSVRLRASYSLDSSIVDRAQAGEVLHVVGRFNRWLKINRNGETAWLADWVDHTRLDQQQTSLAATTANEQTPAAIDNCCFVNRLCQTDQEWVDGYWAYQRNECPASALSQQQTSVQPTSGHAIRFDASPLNIGLVNEALNRIRRGSQYWYDYVITGANLIREDPNSTGMYVLGAQRTIFIPSYGRNVTVASMDVNLARMMSGLVHEACHIHHRDAGFVYNGYTQVEEEIACVAQETAVLRDTVPPHLQGEHGHLGLAHCVGDLTNHPRCSFVRENCEWGPDGELIACPAIGVGRVAD